MRKNQKGYRLNSLAYEMNGALVRVIPVRAISLICAPERVDARQYSIYRGGRSAPRHVWLGRCPERQAGSHPDSERFESRADRAPRQKLQNHQVPARVVSTSSWELFDAQPQSYRDPMLLPPVRVRCAVEADSSQGWHRYVGDRVDVLATGRFGASLPADVVMHE